MRYISLILIALLVQACVSPKQHPRFQNSWNKEYSVAVLPTQITVTESAMIDGTKEIDTLNSNLNHQINDALKTEFEKKGYTVKDPDFYTAFHENDELRHHYKQLSENVGKAVGKLHKSDEAEDSGASIGTLANYFADISDTDLLALPSYNYMELSDATKGVNMAVGLLVPGAMQPNSKAFMNLTLIDSNTGDIMWSFAGADFKIIVHGEDGKTKELVSAEDAMKVIFKSLPDKTKSGPNK